MNWMLVSNELDGSNELDDDGCKLDQMGSELDVSEQLI
jgi:hypothetical protein